jgi:hypothetical protein
MPVSLTTFNRSRAGLRPLARRHATMCPPPASAHSQRPRPEFSSPAPNAHCCLASTSAMSTSAQARQQRTYNPWKRSGSQVCVSRYSLPLSWTKILRAVAIPESPRLPLRHVKHCKMPSLLLCVVRRRHASVDECAGATFAIRIGFVPRQEFEPFQEPFCRRSPPNGRNDRPRHNVSKFPATERNNVVCLDLDVKAVASIGRAGLAAHGLSRFRGVCICRRKERKPRAFRTSIAN